MTSPVPLLDLKAQFATLRDDVLPALLDVVETQQFIMGPAVGELEAAVAAYCGAGAAVACASGTDALLLSFRALDLRPGDEVITTPFSFFATAGAVVNAGGRPRFVDIDPRTYNIDPDLVEAAITDRTRAIEPVHLFGQMAPIERLATTASAHGLKIVEDAAQAIGARRLVGGRPAHAGTVGLTGAFSFFPSKNLGGWGDGGMIVTSDEGLAERLRRLRTHGGAKQYHHEEVGTNSRLDTLQAAVLLRKLAHLDRWNAARRARAARYAECFDDVAEVHCPVTDRGNEHTYHQYTIRGDRRDELQAHLRARQIGCAVYYPTPLHLQPCFQELGYRQGQLPVAEGASAEVLSLPIYPELTDDQQDRVVDAVREFYR